MKEIKDIQMKHLEKYDINVKPFLTLAEIQAIANAIKPDMSWSERRQAIDMGILQLCTDMTKEDLETPHDLLYGCGLIDDVCSCVSNVFEIENAIAYESSWIKLLSAFAKDLPKYAAEIDSVVKKYGEHDSK